MSFFADAFARCGCSGANLAKDARKHRHPPNAAQKSHVSPEVCFLQREYDLPEIFQGQQRLLLWRGLGFRGFGRLRVWIDEGRIDGRDIGLWSRL